MFCEIVFCVRYQPLFLGGPFTRKKKFTSPEGPLKIQRKVSYKWKYVQIEPVTPPVRLWEWFRCNTHLASRRKAATGGTVCRCEFKPFIGAFAKLRKATVSFVMPGCPSVRPSVRIRRDGQMGSHWTDFNETWYLSFFFVRKFVKKIQVLSKSDKINGYFTWRRLHIYDNISLKQSKHILCSITFLSKILPFMT